MVRLKLTINKFIAVIFFSIISLSVIAEELPTQIITPVPAPKEKSVIPQGYVSCFTVNAGWYQGLWYPKRRVCQYNPINPISASTTAMTKTSNAIQGDAWIESYWVCTKYLTQGQLTGQCTHWEWRPGHRVKTLSIY